MMNIVSILFVFVAISASGLAWAQDTNISQTDEVFLTKDAGGAAYELQAAKLATSKASRQDVKKFAEKLVRDHETYNSELEQLSKSVGLTWSTEPDQAGIAHMDDLKRLSGPAFDTLFIKESQRVNTEDKRDADKEKTTTHNEMIKSFITKFAEVDAEHEKMADQLATSKN